MVSAGAAFAEGEREEPAGRLARLIANDLAATDRIILTRLRSEHAPLIGELATHLIAAGGKRLRPMITLAAARLSNYRGTLHRNLAAAVEFIHSATLLHDDVVDESDRRRGQETANRLWGNKPSVLVGDFLFSRAFQLMVETGAIRVLRILSDAAAVIAEGEVMQLRTAGDLATGKTLYLNMIGAKTAALFAAAAEAGGVIAQADARHCHALRDYGQALGIAFQLTDDALDYGGDPRRMGKNVGDDLREGKATLPVLIAYQGGGPAERAFWRRVIEAREIRENDWAQAVHYVGKCGAGRQTLKLAADHAQKACAALAPFPDSLLRDALESVALSVVDRAG